MVSSGDSSYVVKMPRGTPKQQIATHRAAPDVLFGHVGDQPRRKDMKRGRSSSPHALIQEPGQVQELPDLSREVHDLGIGSARTHVMPRHIISTPRP